MNLQYQHKICNPSLCTLLNLHYSHIFIKPSCAHANFLLHEGIVIVICEHNTYGFDLLVALKR
jgi:hypothetical protein